MAPGEPTEPSREQPLNAALALRPNLLPDRPAARPKLSEEEVARILAAAADAKADNTRRAYAKVMRKLLRWLNEHHPECIRDDADWPDNILPLHPETLLAFLTGVRVDPPDGWKRGDPDPPRPSTATLAQYLSVIRAAHRHRRLPDPGNDPLVRDAWDGVRKRQGTRPQGADPLRLQQLRAVVAACSDQDDPDRAARDRALVLVGFFGAFRRSELAALRVADLSTDDEAALLLLERSKTDQAGAGAVVEIPRLAGRPEVCPVEAVEEWRLVLDRLDAESVRGTPHQGQPIGERALFRSWRLDGARLRPGPMSDRGINYVFQRAVERAGLSDAGRLSAHSLRVGFATEAARLNVGLEKLMAQGRWKTERTALRYIKERRRGAEGAAGQVGAALAALVGGEAGGATD